MDSSKIANLIDQLEKPDEIGKSERKKLIQVLQSYDERIVRDNLIESITEISRGMKSKDCWNIFLKDCFKKLGSCINADRVCYYAYEQNRETEGISLKIQWESEYALQHFGNLKNQFIEETAYTKLFKKLTNGSPFQINKISKKESALKSIFTKEGVKSILLLPILINDTFYGAIRIDTCKSERLWTKREISLLQPIMFQIRNLLEKRDMEAQLHETYKQAQIGTWEMNLENNSYSWSPITKEIFEMDREQEPAHDVINEFFFDEKSRMELMKATERAQRTGEPYDLELQIRTAKGNLKWIRDTGQAKFRNGKCVQLFGIVQDIHKRKLAELESEKNKQLLEAIAQQADVAVWVRDIRGNVIFVNDEWKKIFGRMERSLTGSNLYDHFDKEIADDLVASDKNVIRLNEQVVYEEFIDTARGPRHFMVNKFPLEGIAGLEDAVGGIGTDITEIKNTEEKLQEAEQKLLEIIEHSTILFYTHDADHVLTYLSPQSVDFLGYEPEDAQRRWTEFLTDHPINIKGGESTQRAIDTGRAQPPFELQLIRGDGKIIWVEVNEAPVLKDGKTVSIAGSLTDITERKKAQEAIRASLKEKETLLAEIHHRVKNNLAVVASLMQLQAMESENSDLQQQLLESVLRIKSMASIHEHLYQTDNFSKLDFGENLKGLVSDIIETMQFTSEIELRFDCDDVYLNINQAIPSSLIVNEVVTNIIKHGFKDQKKGSITLILQKINDIVHVIIEDDGNGFPEDFNADVTNTLGMQLIKTLTIQLEGSYNYIPLNDGLRFSLQFSAGTLTG